MQKVVALKGESVSHVKTVARVIHVAADQESIHSIKNVLLIRTNLVVKVTREMGRVKAAVIMLLSWLQTLLMSRLYSHPLFLVNLMQP
jgi:hypothetical protein